VHPEGGYQEHASMMKGMAAMLMVYAAEWMRLRERMLM
jgi:hypothetical protein